MRTKQKCCSARRGDQSTSIQHFTKSKRKRALLRSIALVCCTTWKMWIRKNVCVFVCAHGENRMRRRRRWLNIIFTLFGTVSRKVATHATLKTLQGKTTIWRIRTRSESLRLFVAIVIAIAVTTSVSPTVVLNTTSITAFPEITGELQRRSAVHGIDIAIALKLAIRCVSLWWQWSCLSVIMCVEDGGGDAKRRRLMLNWYCCWRCVWYSVDTLNHITYQISLFGASHGFLKWRGCGFQWHLMFYRSCGLFTNNAAAGFSHSDIYQMSAYCRAHFKSLFGVSHGCIFCDVSCVQHNCTIFVFKCEWCLCLLSDVWCRMCDGCWVWWCCVVWASV